MASLHQFPDRDVLRRARKPRRRRRYPVIRPGLGRGCFFALLLEVLVILVAWLVWVGVSHAATQPLYVAAHQESCCQVVDPHRFTAIVGYPGQRVPGIQWWGYTKATRSRDAGLPESWYLHVDGVRVRDTVFHAYVMDPRNHGWQRRVAAACPSHCFLDGLGPTSVSRTSPRLPWTPYQWVTAAATLVSYVAGTGKQVLPNSIGSNPAGIPLVDAAGGRGSTEGFAGWNAAQLLGEGRIWVQERGNCISKLDAYEATTDGDDHFSCYEWHHAPWDTSWLR